VPEAGHQAGRRLSAADEAVEIVDLDGEPISVITRGAMRAANLRHRATYIVVAAPDGAVLVHQRAAWKDIWPSRWDVAFGGICDVAETWRDAAGRELAEEAGVEVVASQWVPRRELSAFAARYLLCADSEAVVLPRLASR